jgi:hypothetical protein
MKRITFALMLSSAAFAVSPAFASVDPCERQEDKFISTTDALRGQADASMAQLAAWDADPSTIPQSVLDPIREAIRTHLYDKWKDTKQGKGMVASWEVTVDNPIAYDKFIAHVYSVDISPEMETEIAKGLFQQKYRAEWKPKMDSDRAELEGQIAGQKARLDEACSPTVFSQIMRSTIGNAILIVNGNFEAAKDESGDIAKAVRAISGISLTDIGKYGFEGGENSEVAKINDAIEGVLERNGMGSETVVGQVFAAVNPTKWRIEVEIKAPDLPLPELPTPSETETVVREFFKKPFG